MRVKLLVHQFNNCIMFSDMNAETFCTEHINQQ
jgi:hypothetical protein